MSLPLTRPSTPSAPITAPDKQAETQEGFAAYVRSEYERRLKERRPFEQVWLLSLAYLDDNHYAQVHRTTGEIYVPEKKFPWEERDSFNHLAPIYETRTAKLTRNQPIMSVRPGSADEDDISSAKVSSKLLQYNREEQHLDEILNQAISWSEATGTSFLKNLWNPNKGTRLMVGGQPVPIGDIETVICSPFTIFPEDQTKPRLEDQFSLIHAVAYPVDSDHVEMLVELYEQQTGETMKPMSEDVTSVSVGRSGVHPSGAASLRISHESLKNHTLVMEYYERPSRKHPDGRFAIVLNSKLVYYGPLPYKKDPDFPFVKIDAIRRPNCFWAKSVIERLTPVQRRYNAIRNRITEYLNRIGVGQWTAEENTTDIDKLTNEPGLVIEHARGSGPPKPVQFPALPSTFVEEVATLEQEFMKISGIHEVSHAQLPRGTGGSPSGVLIAQLQEQDDTRLSTAQRNLDQAVEKMGKQWLLRYSEFAGEKRAFPVMGRNNTIHIMHFDATTIKSYNVIVEGSSALAFTPAARREMVFSMLDRGLFNDPTTGQMSPLGMQKIFELLEFGSWDDFDEDKALPQNRAQYENHLMSAGRQVPVYPWEDHLTHLGVLNRYRQTEPFYELMESPAGPMIAQLFEMHAQAHQFYLVQSMAPQPGAETQPGGSTPEDVAGNEATPDTAKQEAMNHMAEKLQQAAGPQTAQAVMQRLHASQLEQTGPPAG